MHPDVKDSLVCTSLISFTGTLDLEGTSFPISSDDAGMSSVLTCMKRLKKNYNQWINHPAAAVASEAVNTMMFPDNKKP